MSQTSSQTKNPQNTAPFDMKAGHFTLPTLLIRNDDSAALDAFLAQQVARLPQFFAQAPLVIDLGHYRSEQALENFPAIVGMIRGHGMIPVGVRGASAEQQEQARLLELAIMPRLRAQAAEKDVSPGMERPAAATSRPDTLVIDTPVRSGQRIYAEGGDLVLLAGVSSGAEVMADGHVHAYGAVRGRILAGVRDNAGARIFCRDLGAELVAIAGRYRVSEDLPSRHLGRAVQISLQDNSLQFASL
jgi:septum site-determining protein MinC